MTAAARPMTAAPMEAVLRTPAFWLLPPVAPAEAPPDGVAEPEELAWLELTLEPPATLGLGVVLGAMMRVLLPPAPPAPLAASVLMTAVDWPMAVGWETGAPRPWVSWGDEGGLVTTEPWALLVLLPPPVLPPPVLLPPPLPPPKTEPASCWASWMFLGGMVTPADLQPALRMAREPETSTVLGQYWTMPVRTSVRRLPSAAPLQMHLMSWGLQPAAVMAFMTQGSMDWPATREAWLEKARATMAAERAEKRAIAESRACERWKK
ncbi:hypothetical protein Micbo1qcDRAFT_166882 [Microdochium bolleyi]|uniref:Uncharacterized protein n=1 Tax=Microdochium bolleyi TaxID=196109 RepID=A0A136ITW8_9PEZI|nr:hypothetical protein Micbo1qcDRAFT_166882 [Microdochium bolleyi]